MQKGGVILEWIRMVDGLFRQGAQAPSLARSPAAFAGCPLATMPAGDRAVSLLPAVPNASSPFFHREMAIKIKSKHRGCSYLSIVLIYIIPDRYSMKFPFIKPLFYVHALRCCVYVLSRRHVIDPGIDLSTSQSAGMLHHNAVEYYNSKYADRNGRYLEFNIP